MTQCNQAIGRQLREIRLKYGWTQRDVVRRAGYSDRHASDLSAVERGEANFSARKLARIVEALGCTVEDLADER